MNEDIRRINIIIVVIVNNRLVFPELDKKF